MKITLIGACSDLGVHHNGASMGPKVLLKDFNDSIMIETNKNYVKSLDKNDLRKNEDEVNKFNSNLYDAVNTEIINGNFPLIIGGDHSVSIASALASSNNKKIGIIWVDAHTDFNTFETTITGNIHGLPLATIVGYHNEELRGFNLYNTINPKNAVIIGARSIDEAEYKNLEDAGVTYFTTKDIKKNGIQNIVSEAFKIALNGTDGVHISCDLDVIDPLIAPGVSVPEINGITDKDILEITDVILKYKENIVSYDIVEFNPLNDIDNKTEQLALTILEKVKNMISLK